jgi:hypothetical protein
VEEGARLLAVPPLRRSEQSSRGASDPKFALGDFLTQIPLGLLDAFAAAIGRETSQLRVYREVAGKVPPESRVGAAWTVHRDLREKPALLRDGLTVRAATALLGKNPIDSKADRHLSVAERADIVRKGLTDPEVYALIDSEMAQSRAERQTKHRARLFHTELSKRERSLEAELRQLREAKSPFEATVKAELDLNRAAQLVHAVGESLDDLPQPDRLTAALIELGSEVTSVLSAQSDSVDGPVVIDGEVWQGRSARAVSTDSNQRHLSGEGRVVIDSVD